MNLNFIIQPFLHLLIWFYQISGGSLGLAIIEFTVLFRAILLPLAIPALKSQKKMQQLQPHLAKLKSEFGHDKQLHQQKQMELYKQFNVNPLSGCLPYLLQIIFLIILNSALSTFLQSSELFGVAIHTQFLGIDLVKPDPTKILPILTAVSQLFLSVMLLPGLEHHDVISELAKKKAEKTEGKKENDIQDMSASMQKQMLLIMPIMTGFFAMNFPSGLGMYWLATTLFSIGQQWAVSGPGGLGYYTRLVLSKLHLVAPPKPMGAAPVLLARSSLEKALPATISHPLALALQSKASFKKHQKQKKNNRRRLK